MNHEHFMKLALEEARKAYELDEVPVGAIVVCNKQVIAKAHNLTERLTDVTAHAEMQAITMAASYLGGKYLSNCTLYVTLEPCVMCGGAAYWSRISTLVYGASDNKRGFAALNNSILHPKTNIVTGIMEQECSEIISKFFQEKRK